MFLVTLFETLVFFAEGYAEFSFVRYRDLNHNILLVPLRNLSDYILCVPIDLYLKSCEELLVVKWVKDPILSLL